MDMKETTRVEVTAADVDATGTMPPSRLIQLLVLAGMERNRLEGGGKTALRAAFGAAWMFRRISVEQYLPVKEGDVLQGYGSGRTMLAQEYVERGEFRRDGELVGRCDLVMMPVDLKKRLKLKPEEVDGLYATKPLNEVPDFPRLEMLKEFDYPTEKEITTADCDENANHFGSHNYADLICRETGFGVGETRMMTRLQIDYIKECMPGDHIRLGTIVRDGVYIVQGIHVDGRPCFNARFEYV